MPAIVDKLFCALWPKAQFTHEEIDAFVFKELEKERLEAHARGECCLNGCEECLGGAA